MTFMLQHKEKMINIKYNEDAGELLLVMKGKCILFINGGITLANQEDVELTDSVDRIVIEVKRLFLANHNYTLSPNSLEGLDFIRYQTETALFMIKHLVNTAEYSKFIDFVVR